MHSSWFTENRRNGFVGVESFGGEMLGSRIAERG